MKKTTILNSLTTRAEVSLALLLVGTMMMLVVPMSRMVIDILVVLSLSSCMLLLLISVRIQSPLQLLSFPALLLITTLFRLTLNVASTKMILLEGHAGHVIEAFGRVVMGSNLMVGLCVFSIVTIVQFIVVAKGAERVGEVAARFSLDAMPGKQMSIDAELRAGTMTAAAATERRANLDLESRFFGGMDGAMKFVKGDTIAGLLITIINIFGGLAIGMLYLGMSASESLRHFTVLSVGDAMVAQIPSLMVAVAAGLVITRITAEDGARTDLGQQILNDISPHPSATLYVGFFCIVLAALPGFPALPFAVLACVAIIMTVAAWRAAKRKADALAGMNMPLESLRAPGQENAPALFQDGDMFDTPLRIFMPKQLLHQLDPEVLDLALKDTISRLKLKWGAPYPGLRFSSMPTEVSLGHADDVEQLIKIEVNGYFVASFVWRQGEDLLPGPFDPRTTGELGFPGLLKARWLAEEEEGEKGPRLEEVLALSVEAICLSFGARLLSVENLELLIVELRKSQPRLVEQVIPNIQLANLTEIVRILYRNGISLRRLPQICDAVASHLPLTVTDATVADSLLTTLARVRCADIAPDGRMEAFLIGDDVEQLLINYTDQANISDDDNNVEDDVYRKVRIKFSEVAATHPNGIICLLCSGAARFLVSEVASMESPRFCVFSFKGIHPSVKLEIIGRIEMSANQLSNLEKNQLTDDLDISNDNELFSMDEEGDSIDYFNVSENSNHILNSGLRH